MATYEKDQSATEQRTFLRYDHARIIRSTFFDHTNGSGSGDAQRLNGTENEKYGLAKSLSVMLGDRIDMEVFAKYVDKESDQLTEGLLTLLALIAGGASDVVIPTEGNSYATSTKTFEYSGVLLKKPDESAPKAYLNWLIYDRNDQLLDGGYQQLSAAPKERGQDVAHEKLQGSIEIKQAGYVYIYLSNENETPIDVYFDDFSVTHTYSPVVQRDDYYPFGLAFNSQTREDATAQRWKFQGQEHVDDLGLNWYSFKWRNHQPDIGRFFNLDPLAENFYYNSPCLCATTKSDFKLPK